MEFDIYIIKINYSKLFTFPLEIWNRIANPTIQIIAFYEYYILCYLQNRSERELFEIEAWMEGIRGLYIVESDKRNLLQ